MPQKVRQLVAVLVVSLTLGLHWAALQSVAWVSMFVRYSQTTTLQQALAWTFDGQHPCALCELVADGRKATSPAAQLVPLTLLKFDFLGQSTPSYLPPSLLPQPFDPSDRTGFTRFEQPPSPPPRFF